MFAEFETARPRDVNLKMAVMDRAGEVAFIEDKRDLGMSHVVVEEIQSGGAPNGVLRHSGSNSPCILTRKTS